MVSEARKREPSSYVPMARISLTGIIASVGLMVARGFAGPSAPMTLPSAAPPWPPWYIQTHLSPILSPIFSWMAVLLGGCGLAAGLVAVQRGWRPSARWLILGSGIAVITLTVVPPVASGDPFYYAEYGRIAALGHSPYVANPERILSPRDPVRVEVSHYPKDPASRYGPLATLSEAAASKLAGDSDVRTLFWLKVWNSVAFLVLVLALDRLVAADVTRRVRVHLMWSVNPLMLFLLMADGHNDVLATALGVSAILALRKLSLYRAFAAGCLLVLAIAVKASYAVYLGGLAWAARRSVSSISWLALGIVAILVPSYLIVGRAGVSATTFALVGGQQPNLLWHEAAGLLGWQQRVVPVNTLALIVCVLLAGLLLWRLPRGDSDMPAGRVALALALALLISSPYQQGWYDAMLFPLLAIFPATRLDWIVVAHTIALGVGSVPFFYPHPHPALWAVIERIFSDVAVLPALMLISGALLWLCVTRDWRPVVGYPNGHENLVGLSAASRP